jgi:hypothetical protein
MINQAAALVLLLGGVNTSNLSSSERKVQKTLHQEQLDKQNRSKRKAVHPQANAHASTLVNKERAKPKDINSQLCR